MKWNHEFTTILLEEYRKRKSQFQDPNRTKMSSWNEIFTVFKENGYCDNDDTSSDFLQTKFRNLKKTFVTIQNNPEQKFIKWPYYEIMSELIDEENCFIFKVDPMESVENVSLPYVLNKPMVLKIDDDDDNSNDGPTPAKRRDDRHDHDECHCVYLQQYRTKKLQLEEQKLNQFERLISAVEGINKREQKIISLLEKAVDKLDPQS